MCIKKWRKDRYNKKDLDSYSKSEIDEKINNLSKQLEINPDMYKGNDLSKLQQALQYLIDNETFTTIRLNRMYDITGGSLYINNDSFWKYIHVIGGGIIKNDAGYIIDSLGKGNNRNCPIFTQCKFKTNTADVYLCNGDKFIRQNVDRCHFSQVGLVKVDSYLQSIRVHNCEIGQLGCDFINGKMVYDGEIMHNRFESNTNLNAVAIRIQATDEGAISYFGFRIVSNLMEGYVYNTPIILGAGYGLDISLNYFETNKTSIYFECLGKSSKTVTGSIKNNVFNSNKNDYDIQVIGTLYRDQLMVISNTSNQGKGKYFCNTKITPNFDNSNRMYAGGAYQPITSTEYVHKNSYKTYQVDKGNEGIEFEISLNLIYNGFLWCQASKQFICNIKFTYGSSVWYSGHITLLMSIDGAYKENTVKQFLMADIISSRNTSGNVNGNLNNPLEFDYYFKETGNKEIESNVDKATIIIKLPKAKYNSSYNNCNFKSINSIISEFYEDTNN